jgi:hypothetical protein
MKKNFLSEDQYIIVGIDPGVNTGLALFVYNSKDDSMVLFICSSYDISIILDDLLHLDKYDTSKTIFLIEDARERKWFGTAESKIYQKIKSRQPINASELSTYKGMLLGAGSVRRDCAILESVMQKMSYNYQMIAPKNNKTKTTAAHFKALTGWTERTNEHGRDAAMLVLSNYRQAIKMINK